MKLQTGVMSVNQGDRKRRVERHKEARADHPLSSRVVHRLGELSSTSGATGAAAALSLAFLLGAVLSSRTADVLVVFEAIAAAVTLVMVFALQHAASRQQVAVQRKLDEILNALPQADSRLVRVETASPGELDELEERHDDLRRTAVREGG